MSTQCGCQNLFVDVVEWRRRQQSKIYPMPGRIVCFVCSHFIFVLRFVLWRCYQFVEHMYMVHQVKDGERERDSTELTNSQSRNDSLSINLRTLSLWPFRCAPFGAVRNFNKSNFYFPEIIKRPKQIQLSWLFTYIRMGFFVVVVVFFVRRVSSLFRFFFVLFCFSFMAFDKKELMVFGVFVVVATILQRIFLR